MSLILTVVVFGICYLIVLSIINYYEDFILDNKIQKRVLSGIWLDKLDNVQQERNQLLSIDMVEQTCLFNHQLKMLMKDYSFRGHDFDQN